MGGGRNVRYSFLDANPTVPVRLQFTLVSKDGKLETVFNLSHSMSVQYREYKTP